MYAESLTRYRYEFMVYTVVLTGIWGLSYSSRLWIVFTSFLALKVFRMVVE